MPDLTGSFSGRATSQSTITLDDVSNHDLNLLKVRGVQKSPDEEWNNSKITYWGTADLIAVSPSGPGPANAPMARLPKPASGSRPVAAMARKLTASDTSTAAPKAT